MSGNSITDATRSSNSDREADDSTRLRLNTITDETRFTLLKNIVGHPEGMPSLTELDYVNPSKNKSTIKGHLDELIAIGVVERFTKDENRGKENTPYAFYALTDDGEAFLEEHRLLQAKETLERYYAAVEKTEEIQAHEAAPRPPR